MLIQSRRNRRKCFEPEWLGPALSVLASSNRNDWRARGHAPFFPPCSSGTRPIRFKPVRFPIPPLPGSIAPPSIPPMAITQLVRALDGSAGGAATLLPSSEPVANFETRNAL